MFTPKNQIAHFVQNMYPQLVKEKFNVVVIYRLKIQIMLFYSASMSFGIIL